MCGTGCSGLEGGPSRRCAAPRRAPSGWRVFEHHQQRMLGRGTVLPGSWHGMACFFSSPGARTALWLRGSAESGLVLSCPSLASRSKAGKSSLHDDSLQLVGFTQGSEGGASCSVIGAAGTWGGCSWRVACRVLPDMVHAVLRHWPSWTRTQFPSVCRLSTLAPRTRGVSAGCLLDDVNGAFSDRERVSLPSLTEKFGQPAARHRRDCSVGQPVAASLSLSCLSAEGFRQTHV